MWIPTTRVCTNMAKLQAQTHARADVGVGKFINVRAEVVTFIQLKQITSHLRYTNNKSPEFLTEYIQQASHRIKQFVSLLCVTTSSSQHQNDAIHDHHRHHNQIYYPYFRK